MLKEPCSILLLFLSPEGDFQASVSWFHDVVDSWPGSSVHQLSSKSRWVCIYPRGIATVSLTVSMYRGSRPLYWSYTASERELQREFRFNDWMDLKMTIVSRRSIDVNELLYTVQFTVNYCKYCTFVKPPHLLLKYTEIYL